MSEPMKLTDAILQKCKGIGITDITSHMIYPLQGHHFKSTTKHCIPLFEDLTENEILNILDAGMEACNVDNCMFFENEEPDTCSYWKTFNEFRMRKNHV